MNTAYTGTSNYPTSDNEDGPNVDDKAFRLTTKKMHTKHSINNHINMPKHVTEMSKFVDYEFGCNGSTGMSYYDNRNFWREQDNV